MHAHIYEEFIEACLFKWYKGKNRMDGRYIGLYTVPDPGGFVKKIKKNLTKPCFPCIMRYN